MNFHTAMLVPFSEPIFVLPDTLTHWPWKRKLHPLYLEAKTESSAWVQSLNAFSPRAQRAFDLCDFSLLASLAYPIEDKDVIRAGCDAMNLFFLFDEYTDVATPREAEQMAAAAMDALRNTDKPRPTGECVVGEAARQFWELSSKCASEGARRRFIDNFDTYTAAVVQQAHDRAQSRIRTIKDYFVVRRDTIGAKPAFVILQFGLDLPDEVFTNPEIQRLSNACVDMIILGNDFCSYNVEQARGDDGHNIVTIVMHHERIGLNAAMRWIGDYHSSLEQDFLNGMKSVPSFGEELNPKVRRYIDGLANWVRANDCWDFESHRYFATTGLEIQRTRKVALLPRSVPRHIKKSPNSHTSNSL
ncbi:hypothetical protein DXG01_013552 [Tephrocybe rancida]|nr:hypothetical protein DXG01_013552 [Tephrocybe rancida]